MLSIIERTSLLRGFQTASKVRPRLKKKIEKSLMIYCILYAICHIHILYSIFNHYPFFINNR